MSSHSPQTNHSSGISTHTCVVCNGQWPLHLTVKHGEEYICCPCYGKMKDDASFNLNVTGHHIGKTNKINKSAAGWIVLTLLVLGGIGYGVYTMIGGSKVKEEPKTIVVTDPFASTLVISNVTQHTGAVITGSAFFLETPEGVRAVVPATPLPPPAKGTLAPDAQPFAAWNFITTGTIRSTIPGKRILPSGNENRVWLMEYDDTKAKMFSFKSLKPQAQSTPQGSTLLALTLKSENGQYSQISTPVKVEAAFLSGAKLSIVLPARAAAKDFIGAPLINKAGELAGVISAYGEQPDSQGTVKYLEAVSNFELLGQPQPALPKENQAAAPKKQAIQIIPGGSPYDRPEYKDLK